MNCKNSSQLDLENEVRSLESKYQASQADIRDLENKLATIERIARINASYRQKL